MSLPFKSRCSFSFVTLKWEIQDRWLRKGPQFLNLSFLCDNCLYQWWIWNICSVFGRVTGRKASACSMEIRVFCSYLWWKKIPSVSCIEVSRGLCFKEQNKENYVFSKGKHVGDWMKGSFSLQRLNQLKLYTVVFRAFFFRLSLEHSRNWTCWRSWFRRGLKLHPEGQ